MKVALTQAHVRCKKVAIVPWSQNGSFQTLQSFQFRISFCSDLHHWSWILGKDRNGTFSCTSGRGGKCSLCNI